MLLTRLMHVMVINTPVFSDCSKIAIKTRDISVDIIDTASDQDLLPHWGLFLPPSPSSHPVS